MRVMHFSDVKLATHKMSMKVHKSVSVPHAVLACKLRASVVWALRARELANVVQGTCASRSD